MGEAEARGGMISHKLLEASERKKHWNIHEYSLQLDWGCILEEKEVSQIQSDSCSLFGSATF